MGDHAADVGLYLRRIFFGNHAAVELEADPPGDDVGVGTAFDQAHIQVGVRDAFHLRADLAVQAVLGIQGAQNFGGSLQRVHTGLGNSRVRHLAVYGHFHLQATVVRRNDLVRKARRDQQVRAGQLLGQQPSRTHFAAEFFVIRKQQIHPALERVAECLDSTHRKRVGGEIAFAHGGRTAVNAAVHHRAAVGVLRPTIARRHHIAVGIERNRRPIAVAPVHHQIRDALQASGVHQVRRNRVALGVQAHGIQQISGALGVRRVVTRRGVGGDLDQALQKAQLFVKVPIDPGVQADMVQRGCGHGGNLGANAAKRSGKFAG